MAISVEARTEIISLVVGMFGAAPGASVLSDLVAAVEGGTTISQLAANLSATAEFKAIYPTFMTNEEYAAKVVANLLTEASTEAKAEATTVLTAAINGGLTRANAMVEAIKFVGATESTNASFGSSAAAFDNKVSVAIYYSVDKALSASTLADLQAIVNGVTSDAATVTSAKATVDGTANVGTTFTLTSTIDSVTGGAGNDTFNGTQTTAAAATFTALDAIDGGLGNDTLKVVQTAALDTTALGGITVKNVENVELTSGAAVTANTTAWTGVTSVVASGATDANVTAAATSDVSVTAAALTGAAGAVTVNGGKDVTVVASDTSTTGAASGNTILVGGSTAPTGAVKVTYTETISDAKDAGVAGSSITVTGGTTVEVNSNATAGAGSNALDVLTLGAVAVNGKSTTTAVTVNQSAATATWNGTTANNISIVNGGVTVTDTNAATAADTIATVSLSNFGNSTINSTVLSTLNLTETGSGASGTVTLDKTAADTSTAATTLGLNTSGSFGLISGTQADAYKTLNVAASATTTLADIAMDALTTINVSGEGKTTFTALTAAQNAKLASIVSSGGGLTVGTELATGVAFTGGAGVESVMIGATTKTVDMGAGDDVVTVSTTTMGAGGTVKGGEGSDTLVANTNSSAFSGLPAFAGFEVLRVAGAAAQGAHNAVGFTSLEVGALAGNASFTNVAAGVGLTVLADMAQDLTFTLADATGTADAVNLTLSSSGAIDLSGDTITLAGVETVNVTSTDTNTTAHVNTIELVASSAKTLTLTGNTGVVVVNANASITSMDASAIALGKVTDTGVTYTSTNSTVAEAVSIKGSNGVDVLSGSATAIDTILGGDGADTLIYTGAADVFTGGAGNDTFDVNATGTSTAFLTISDLTAGDKIDLAAAALTAVIADATLGAKTTFGSAATFAQALDAAAAGAANNVEWFQFESNTYLVVDASAGATFVSGTDSVIKITGLVDLSNSTLATEVLTIV